LDPPRTVLAATEEYRQDMDIVGRWIEECCDLDPAAKEPTSSLYREFAIWAELELGWKNLSSTKFARELSEREFRKEKGTGGVRCTVGLRLKRQMIRQTAVMTLSR
jgi:phage/plasmid-associated DNA primase